MDFFTLYFSDSTYANILLTHAKQLYEFATQFKGKYSDSVNQAAAYYRLVVYLKGDQPLILLKEMELSKKESSACLKACFMKRNILTMI